MNQLTYQKERENLVKALFYKEIDKTEFEIATRKLALRALHETQQENR